VTRIIAGCALHECARAHVDVGAVGMRCAVGKQRRRLIAVNNTERDALPVCLEMTEVVACRHARRQARTRDGEQVQQARVPVQGLIFHRSVRAAFAGSAAKVCSAVSRKMRKTGQRTEGQTPFGLGLRHRRQMVETPAQLARAVVRREHEAGGGVDRLGVRRKARQPFVCPPVCQLITGDSAWPVTRSRT